MKGGGWLRFLLMGIIALLLYKTFFGSDTSDATRQQIKLEPREIPEPRAKYQYCDLWSERFFAQFTSRGATLKHFKLTTAKYTKGGEQLDLSTTPSPHAMGEGADASDPSLPGDHEFRQQLFVQWRNPTEKTPENVEWNVDYDSVDYRVTQAGSGESCQFEYRDEKVRLTKTISATERPYELEVKNRIENLASERLSHAAAIDTVAWRLTEEVQGEMFRVSPYITHVECVPVEGDALRLGPEDFEHEDFEQPEFDAMRPWGWRVGEQAPANVAVSNAYFTHALAPASAPAEPVCLLQIEHRHAQPGKPASALVGSFYRARLAYPLRTLDPGGSAEYVVQTYIGPKERELLGAAGAAEHRFIELIDLGFFSAIAKILVTFLLKVYELIPNWGVAIIVLTVTARILLFPLSWPGIKQMIRMRELKPELDALNEKFKDDAQAKGLAQMELWRKHGVNPLKGCLPQLASMPVWFALYTTLQTAVELYNIPFLWFPDLSERDPYYILPFVIGGTFFVQQKIMPLQADPMQQKMMMYFMPAMFTVFMLFLPAGLGVYMFTNSVLAIVQQQVVERQVRRQTGTTPTPPAEDSARRTTVKRKKRTQRRSA